MANVFKIGDRVKTVANPSSPYIRTNGIVVYIACALALKSNGKLCDKKKCNHIQRDYVWVVWPGAGVAYSYHYTDLVFNSPTIQPSASIPITNTTDDPKKETATADKEIYAKEVKSAIENVVQEKKTAVQKEQDFFRYYNGLTKMGYDKRGRPVIQEAFEEKEPIKENELDYRVYSGLASGLLKKPKL